MDFQKNLQVAQAAKWLQQAEAILICAGNLFTLESDAGGPFRQPPLTKTEGLEYGIPTPGSWNPIRALWHEQPARKVSEHWFYCGLMVYTQTWYVFDVFVW